MIARIKKRVRDYLTRDKSVLPVRVALPERLRAFFLAVGVEALDIGARGGPFPALEALKSCVDLFLCEPEAEEAQRLKRSLEGTHGWKSVTVIPNAITSIPGTVAMRVAEHAGLTSLFDFNYQTLGAYHSINAWGGIRNTVNIPAITLDEAAKRYGFSDLAFLKLDTQGTELDILRSGTREALPSVVAVYVEMERIPIYKDQPLLGDVHQFLGTQGFTLFDLKRTALRRKTTLRVPYSKRELAWAHGLYFRERSADGGALTPVQAVRSAALALALEYFDYAIVLLERPAVAEYCKAIGFARIEREVASYASAFWLSLRPRLGWLKKRQAVATLSNDRLWER